MRLVLFLHAALCQVLVGASFIQGADLDKIDRLLVKEPVYQSKAPKYALLVFGPEARTRVWLVLDGTTLYVDRNDNGDLTEAGEKVAGTKGSLQGENGCTFAVGELRDGTRRHLNAKLIVSEMKSSPGRDPHSMAFSIIMEVELPGYHGMGEGGRVVQKAGTSDFNGDLQMSARPQDAPILHFGGPWAIALDGRPTFRVNREMEMYLVVGTPGRGKGTFVASQYEGVVPANVVPRAVIAFPAQKPGDPPVKINFELKGRC